PRRLHLNPKRAIYMLPKPDNLKSSRHRPERPSSAAVAQKERSVIRDQPVPDYATKEVAPSGYRRWREGERRSNSGRPVAQAAKRHVAAAPLRNTAFGPMNSTHNT